MTLKRRITLPDEQLDAICNALRSGKYMPEVAKELGLAVSTIRNILDRANRYAEFEGRKPPTKAERPSKRKGRPRVAPTESQEEETSISNAMVAGYMPTSTGERLRWI